MAITRAIKGLTRQPKIPRGICFKVTAVTFLGLCFIVFWSMYSSPASSLTTQRQSFDDITEPVAAAAANHRPATSHSQPKHNEYKKHESHNKPGIVQPTTDFGGGKKVKEATRKKQNKDILVKQEDDQPDESENDIQDSQNENENDEDQLNVADGKEELQNGGEEMVDAEGNSIENVDEDKDDDDEIIEEEVIRSKRKYKGPVFDTKANYTWKLCSTKSKHNYIPCIDVENGEKLQTYRHRERSCPKTPPMCLVPLPHDGYGTVVPWPDSKFKILYKNVAHPKLAAYIKKHSWIVESGEYLTFPQNQSEFKGGVPHYLEFIEDMVPDIEWGKNIRVVLDIGCTDSSFVAALLEKGVLTLTLGLKDDLVDLAQVSLERGFPTVVSSFGNRRLPFPSGVIDAIHCGGCTIPWHSNGGKLLLEMNRILRPSGYFILSTVRDSIEEEEAMTKITTSICWNILAHKNDEDSEVGLKIYQKPEANTIYALRRKKFPPLCHENENPDAAWYFPMTTCLHRIPSSIEQHGSEWPEEWPKRLETYPDWLGDKQKLVSDTNHWKAIVDNSYFPGMGIDWSTIRNVMDMKAIYGGFAAALSQEKIWVMNVIPVHAPDTLAGIYERGLIGVYHDWCESFGTYPRSYDLLHADHLFSRLKNRLFFVFEDLPGYCLRIPDPHRHPQNYNDTVRADKCKQPISIVVEMDRILRPGGWVIVRDKIEILDPLEAILRSMHWDIRMTYAQEKEGILCAQKTLWRP
ncbi:hypothetical protein ACFE04_027052 [Oxalis oulophora]